MLFCLRGSGIAQIRENWCFVFDLMFHIHVCSASAITAWLEVLFSVYAPTLFIRMEASATVPRKKISLKEIAQRLQILLF